MKLTIEQQQKLCDCIEKSLNDVTINHIIDENEENLPLVDFLSSGNDISNGQGEITNLVEQLYFEMDKWEI
jgi:hypothetical protein